VDHVLRALGLDRGITAEFSFVWSWLGGVGSVKIFGRGIVRAKGTSSEILSLNI